jgi:hypothetical protein
MADLLKILKEKQMPQPVDGETKPAVPPPDSETDITTEHEGEVAAPTPQIVKQAQEIAVPNGSQRTPWGIPIPEGWDPADPVFQRHPAECDCYRHGVLRCGVPCIWAWVPGAQPGDKAWRIKDV